MENRKKEFRPNAWMIEGISIIIIMGMALWTIGQTGILTQIGTEDLYWERARFILGQGGATLYTGSSMCSLGYSLLLVPICALINSPYGAYKAAILLNGFLLCLTYLMSVKTARKLFSGENDSFLATACFFAIFTPALFASRTFTGPEAAVLFLTWTSLYLLAAIWKAPRRFRQRLYWRLHLMLLAVCMILIGFLQITALGIILAVTALLACYVKRKKIEENSFLLFVLAVLLGLAAGNIAERVFLFRFSADLDITTVRSSLEVLLDAVGELQETDYLYTLFTALTGKFYSLLIASFLLLCPALWFFCRKLFGRMFQVSVKEKNAANAESTVTEDRINAESTTAKDCTIASHNSDFLICVTVCIFLAQMLFMSLCDRAGSYDSSLLSLSGLEMVLSPMILLGIVCFRQSRDPEKEATGYLLLLCICTFLVENTLQSAGTESISSAYCGFFTLFRTDGALMKPMAAVYTVTCLVLLAALLLFALLRVPSDEKTREKACEKTRTGFPKTDFSKTDYSESDYYKSEELEKTSDTVKTAGFRPGKQLAAALRGFGVVICVCLSIYMNMEAVSLTAGANSDDYLANAAPAASVISGAAADSECLYFEGSASDDALAVLQSLLPDEKISVLEDDAEARELFYDGLDEESDNLIILTGSSASSVDTYKEKLDSYRILYTTETWAIWAKKGSQAYSELEEGAAARVENVPLNSNEEEEAETESETETAVESSTGETALTASGALLNTTVIYGGSMVLSPGTYQMTIYLHTNTDEEMDGTITISDGDGTLAEASYTQESFDENGDAILSMTFTDRDVMRKVSMTISGTMPTVSTVSQVTCQKISGLFTLSLDTSGKLRKTTQKIQSTDEMAGTKGTVAYVDKLAEDADELSLEVLENLLPEYEVTAVTVDKLDAVDTDYLIGLTTSHSYYGAMERYSIIRRDGTYTLLVRNDSELYEECRKSDMILSDGYEIDISVFASADDDNSSAITLEKGDYNYHLRLAFNPELVTGEDDDTGAIVRVFSEGEEIASVEVSCGQMLERIDGITEVVIPLNLSKKTKNITCTVEMTDSINAVLTPLSIELASEMYQLGKNEDLTEIISLIETVEKGAVVYVARTSTAKSNTRSSCTYLQELLPDYPVTEITYTEAAALTGDGLLLTYGFSSHTMKMAGTYSILAHAGQYTLWAKSTGEYLQQLTAAGAAVLSSGSKISVESVAAMAGVENAEKTDADRADYAAMKEDADTADAAAATESAIAYLPKAQYRIYLKLTAQELDLDDTVEVCLYRDSTDSEIEEEIEELTDSGYTTSEAEELVSRRVKCGSTSLDACQLLNTDGLLMSVTTSNIRMENLTCEVYTWHGGSVGAEILWVELVS